MDWEGYRPGAAVAQGVERSFSYQRIGGLIPESLGKDTERQIAPEGIGIGV